MAISYGSQVKRKSNGDTGKVIGMPFKTDSGKDAVMVRWDGKSASPITISSLEEM
jgi:hypothetical protein